jgi:Ser/Thr protein kinase RdoA (MazF antagonist)
MSEQFDQIAHYAIDFGPIISAQPALISHRENTVYSCKLITGAGAVLRLHRAGYMTDLGIVAELAYMSALLRAGFATPAPIPTPSDDLLVALPQGTRATLLSWCDGDPIGRGGRLLDHLDQTRLMRRLGACIAQLHNISDDIFIDEISARPHWTLEGLLGPNSVWGSWRTLPLIGQSNRVCLEQAESLSCRKLTTYSGRADVALIYADLMRENIFDGADGLTLIDFYDCSWGYRLYDLMTALAQSLDYPDLADQTTHLIAGYAAQRSISTEGQALLLVFAFLRVLAGLGWVQPR